MNSSPIFGSDAASNDRDQNALQKLMNSAYTGKTSTKSESSINTTINQMLTGFGIELGRRDSNEIVFAVL